MKVVVFTDTRGWGGTEQHTVQLTRALADGGHQATIVELGHREYSGRPAAVDPRVAIASLDCEPPATIGFGRWMRLLRPLRAEVAILAKGGFWVGNVAFDLAARLSFGRYAVVEHSTANPLPPRTSRRHLRGLVPGLGLWWEAHRLRHRARAIGPHRVVCVSHAVARRLTEFGVPAAKIAVVHSGVDVERFRPDAERRRRRRAAWSLAEDTVVVGSVGRLDPFKRCDVLVRAFLDVARSRPALPLRLVLVGDGPEASRLRTLAGTEGVVAFPGRTDAPWDVYPAFDVFAQASAREGLPLTLLEAMACGCLPVVTAVGGVPEVVRDASLGWLVPAGDEAELRHALLQAAECARAGAAPLRRRVREHVASHFDLGRQMVALVALLETL